MGQSVSRRHTINNCSNNNENEKQSIERFSTTPSKRSSSACSTEYNELMKSGTKITNNDGGGDNSSSGPTHTVHRVHSYPPNSNSNSKITTHMNNYKSDGSSLGSPSLDSCRSSTTQAFMIGVDAVEKCNMNQMNIDVPDQNWRAQFNEQLKRSHSSPENPSHCDEVHYGRRTKPGALRPSHSLSSLGCWDRYSFSITENDDQDLKNIECCKNKSTSRRLIDHNDTKTTYQSPWDTCVPETPVGTKISLPFTAPVTLVIDRADDMTIINSFRPLLNTFPFTVMDFWAVETLKSSNSETPQVLESFVKPKKQHMVWRGCINTDQSLHEFVRHSVDVTFAPGVGVPGRMMVHKLPVYASQLGNLTNYQFTRVNQAKDVGLTGTLVGLPLENHDGGFIGCVVFYSKQPIYSSTQLLPTTTAPLNTNHGQKNKILTSPALIPGNDAIVIIDTVLPETLDADTDTNMNLEIDADVKTKSDGSILVDKDTSSARQSELVLAKKTQSKVDRSHVHFQSDSKEDSSSPSAPKFLIPTKTQRSILTNPTEGTSHPVSVEPQNGYLNSQALNEAKTLLKMMITMYNNSNTPPNSTTASAPIVSTSGSDSSNISSSDEAVIHEQLSNDLFLVDQMAAVENKERRKMSAHEIEWDIDVESSPHLSLLFQAPEKAPIIQPSSTASYKSKIKSKSNTIRPCGVSRLVDVLDFNEDVDCIVHPGA